MLILKYKFTHLASRISTSTDISHNLLYVTISYSDKFGMSVFVLFIQLCTWLLSMRRMSMLQYLF